MRPLYLTIARTLTRIFMRDRQAIFNAVKSGYEQQFQLTWLEPVPFNNTNTFANNALLADL